MKPINEIADHKEAAEILNAEFASLGWHKTTVHGGHRTKDDTGWEHFTFQVEFVPPYKSPVFLDWKNGIGHVFKNGPFKGKPTKPNPAEVLACHCRDYRDAKGESFDDWAGNYGYDTDSRKAFRIYEDCLAIGPKLKALGLTSQQIERFADLSSML